MRTGDSRKITTLGNPEIGGGTYSSLAGMQISCK